MSFICFYVALFSDHHLVPLLYKFLSSGFKRSWRDSFSILSQSDVTSWNPLYLTQPSRCTKTYLFVLILLQRARRQPPTQIGPDYRHSNVSGSDGVRRGKLQPSFWASIPVTLPHGRYRRQRCTGEIQRKKNYHTEWSIPTLVLFSVQVKILKPWGFTMDNCDDTLTCSLE